MLKIEYVKKEDLKPYENNAKIHTKAQIDKMKKSIRDHGFNDPIAVWKNNEIIEGHGRLLAVMEMKNIDEVPIIRLDSLTDEQRRAYMLIHNKLTMDTGFDIDLLQIELNNIVDIDMSDFGFEINVEVPEEKKKDLVEASYNEKVSVVIDCNDDDEAERIFNKLTSEGYTCHISTL